MAQSREEKDRVYLQESDQFRRFLHGIYQEREAALADMAEADDTTLRKLAGQITALKGILDAYDYEEIRSRRTG